MIRTDSTWASGASWRMIPAMNVPCPLQTGTPGFSGAIVTGLSHGSLMIWR